MITMVNKISASMFLYSEPFHIKPPYRGKENEAERERERESERREGGRRKEQERKKKGVRERERWRFPYFFNNIP